MGNSSSKSKRSKKGHAAREILSSVPNNEPMINDHEFDEDEDEIIDYYREEFVLNIDSCIDRLLVAGNKRNIGKMVCLNQSEVIAICQYSFQLFMSQPVSSD